MRLAQQPIITSLCDTDLYKFSMQAFFLEQTPTATGRYKFHCRTKGVDLTPILSELREQLEAVGHLRMTDTEIRYLAETQKHLSANYLAFLRDFQLDNRDVRVSIENGQLTVDVGGNRTPLHKGSPWEIYTLALVNELYFRHITNETGIDWDEARRRLMAQLQPLADLKARDPDYLSSYALSEYGTRRRFSHSWQREVLNTLKHVIPAQLFGTSNVHLAREFGIRPVGTMAHEYLQAWQALVHPLDAQRKALDAWANQFRGRLGYALTDVIGMDAFCADLDHFLAKAYDGFRQDSGDPVVWGEKLLKRLEEVDVDPRTKYAQWGDSLNVPKTLDIYKVFRGRIKTGFAIGTQLTNDVGPKAINIVMKLVECNGRPVAKLSDSPGKTMCEDPNYVRWLAASYGREQEFVQ